MKEFIYIVITSSVFSSITNWALQFLNKWIDNSKERREKREKELAKYMEKKENVYIAAIGRLLQIRRGFDYTHNDFIMNEKIQERIHKENTEFIGISPKLRLYSSDKIFNIYKELSTYARFAYAPERGPRLFEESKWAYDTRITLLARLMQEDLGYREYISEYDTVICPDCGCEHDMVSKCPKCGMTYSELQIKLEEIVKKEIQDYESHNNDSAEEIINNADNSKE